MGVSWDEFVGTGANDGFVQSWLGRIGWLYLVCAILCLTVRPKRWIQLGGLVVGSGLLVLLSYAKYVSTQRQLPMFVEHGGQMLIPILLVLALTLGVRHRATVITALVAFIAIFAGHGAYAIGMWPTPSNFYAMTTVILGVDHSTATIILRTAGVLDFVICVGVFIPGLRRISAIYGLIWGGLTALARPVAGMSLELNYWGADHFIHEAILRAPHYLIPLYLFILWQWPKSNSAAAEPEPNSSVTNPKPSSKNTT